MPPNDLTQTPGRLRTCVDDDLDDLCHLALEERVEDLDEEQEAGAEDSQGAGQQNQAHSQV